MEATLPVAPLRAALPILAAASDKRTAPLVGDGKERRRGPTPVAAHLRIATRLDPYPAVELVTTDGTCAVSLALHGPGVDVDGAPAEALVPFDRFQAIIAQANKDTLNVMTPDKKTDFTIRIEVGTSQFKLTAPPADLLQYPGRGVAPPDGLREVVGKALARAVAGCLPCTDDESDRFAFGGVRFEADDGALRLVATDGRRLATFLLPATALGSPGPLPEKSSRVVPTRAARVLETLATRAKDSGVQFGMVDGGLAWFLAQTEGGVIALRTRIAEGRYPDWRAVLPAGEPLASAALDAPATVKSAFEQARICTCEDHLAVEFEFDPASSRALVWAEAPAVGLATRDLALSGPGVPVTASLNPTWMMQALEPLRADQPARLEFHGWKSPVVVRADDYSCVVMTMIAGTRRPPRLDACRVGA